MPLIAPAIASDCSWAAWVPVCTLTFEPTTFWMRSFSSSGVTPRSAATDTVETLPMRLYQRWASLNVITISAAPPSDELLPNSTMPTSFTGWVPCRVCRPTLSPTVQVVVVGQLLVDGKLARGVGEVPVDRGQRR